MSLSGRVTSRLGRSKVALATVVALAAVLGGTAPVAIRALEVNTGAPASLTGVPVKLDTPGKATPAKVVNQATRRYKATAAQWPAAASGSVEVQAATAGQAVGPKASIPGTPLWVQSAAGAGQGTTTDAAVSSEVSATVLPHSQAAPLGVSGVVLQLRGQAPGNGKVRVGLDYASFAQAYGGNYGTRLELVELPALRADHAAAGGLPRADPARIGAGLQGHDRIGSGDPGPGRGRPSHVVLRQAAATAAATGGRGPRRRRRPPGRRAARTATYPPTKLEPDGTWSEGGDSGAFTYSYPIALPSARGSLTPTVSLAYDSQSVDGQTATTQAQAYWLGRRLVDAGLEHRAARPPRARTTPRARASPDGQHRRRVLRRRDRTDGRSTAPTRRWSSCPPPPRAGSRPRPGRPRTTPARSSRHVAQASTVFGKYSTSSPGSDYWTVTERDGTEYEFGLQHLPG